MSNAAKPKYRIFKTLPLAQDHAKKLTKETKVKHIATCVLPKAYLAAPEDFNPIESGFGYPTF